MTLENHNYITKAKLNRIRDRIERFRYMKLTEFIDLVLSCFNYQITDHQPSSTNILIINSSNQFTFCNNSPYEEEKSIRSRGIHKLYTEYYDEPYEVRIIPDCESILVVAQDKINAMFFVKPRKYNYYTPYKVE